MFSLRSLSHTIFPKHLSFSPSKLQSLNSIFSQQRFFAEQVDAIDLKKGDIISRKGRYWKVLSTFHNAKQQRAAIIQVELVDVLKETKLDERLRPTESVDVVEMRQNSMVYKGKNEKGKYLFENQDGEEVVVDDKIMSGKVLAYLGDEMQLQVTTIDEKPVLVDLPMYLEVVVKTVDLKFASNNTAGPSGIAILENGRKVEVPGYIKEGEKIKIKTATETFVSRITNQ